MSLRPAAFLDRDGVLNRDEGYVSRSADFEWMPGVFDALARLRDAGHALVIITNQSGIARGFYTEADYQRLTGWMRGELRAQGIELDAVYHCPHHPEGTMAEWRRDCDCRKPQPGMILRAARELRLDLAGSILFGDKPSDIEAGRRAGVSRCHLIGTTKVPHGVAADSAHDTLHAAVTHLFATPAPAATLKGRA